MLSEKNVTFYMNDNVTEVKGVDGKVKRQNTLNNWFLHSKYRLEYLKSEKKF